MNQQRKQWFTLVELIVVITILAILWTIAFISLQGYSKDARDSTRLSDLSAIKTSLELFHLDAGKYPYPTNYFTITYTGSNIWHQWTFWDDTFKNVTKLDKVPKDPLTEKEYTFSLTALRQQYQLAGIMEWENLAMIENSYAWDTQATAIVVGNYNGFMSKVLSGSECKILSLPSIVSNQPNTTTDLETILTNTGLVYNGYNNLPTNYRSSNYNADGGFDFSSQKLVVYSDNESCNNLYDTWYVWVSTRWSLVSSLQQAYSGTILETSNNINIFNDIDLNDAWNINTISMPLINNWLGGNLDTGSNISWATTNSWKADWDAHSDSNVLNGIWVDSQNNVYVVWNTANGWTTDFYLRKLDENGWEVWTEEWDGHTSNDTLTSVVIDSWDNIIVGWFTTNAGNQNFYVKKFDTNATLVWEQEWDYSTQTDGIYGLALDSWDNVYAVWDTGTSPWVDFYMRKITSGGTLDWEQTWDRNSNVDSLLWIDINGSNIYTAWATNNAWNTNFYLAKLQLSNGSIIWENEWDGHANYDRINAIKTDGSWNIYIAGSTYNGAQSDFYISKRDTATGSGTAWTLDYDGYGSLDSLWDLDLDSDGNVYVGWYIVNGANVQFYVNKLNPAGESQWVKEWDWYGSQDEIRALRIDRWHNVFVGGYTTNGGNFDYYVRKLYPDGNFY